MRFFDVAQNDNINEILRFRLRMTIYMVQDDIMEQDNKYKKGVV